MGLESQSPSAPIAVVGISCRLPGSSNSPDELWKFLSRGGEGWSPVPEQRFNGAAFNHPHPDDPNGTSHHQGGHFIDSDVRDFDNSFFHLSPQQAAAMDPQQRFLLEMSYEALENAGWSIDHVAGSSTSVYAATFTNDYERNLNKDVLDLPVYYSTGTEKAILANRISHYFDLHGPSMTLDTACSGGLVALHQACQSLRDGESSAAIVAAANLTLSPDQHIGMSKLHLVGGSGRSFPFDDRGTGYGRGEGCVVLVLKLLANALRDRDPVRVVIRGTAVNQDGHTPSGITYPNGKAQADLIRTAYTRSCLRPQDVPYVEAHGTGTVAGDTEELNALAEVFSTPARSMPLYVGSIKGNIGHGENVSGLASFVKATLILEHELVPPVAGFANPKPGLPLDKMNIPTTLTPLPVAPGITPTVSINSFGFGGTNSHAILQRGLRSTPTPSDESPRLFILSAHNEASLSKMIQDHLDWLENEPCPSLADLSYTLCHRRSWHNWRFGCVAEDKASLIEKLQRGLNSRSFRRRRLEPYIVFVFTGQGAQWAGMGRELFNGPTSSIIFQKSIRTSRKILASLGAEWNLEEELVRDATETRLNSALLAQPATTAIQIALVELLRAQGIRPRIVVGHSSGEIAAAYAAGRISHRAALSIAYHRGYVAGLKRDLPRGAMMSVGLGEREVEPFMEGLEGCAGIACVNSPNNVTISGDSEAIDTIAMRLAASKNSIFHKKLIVDTAYHSHHMQAVAEEYLSRLDQLQDESWDPQYGDIAFISSVSGSLKTDNFDSEYWTTNLVSKVRFCDAIQALVRHRLSDSSGQDALFIEIGPHNSLAGPVRQSLSAFDLPKMEFDYYSALQRKTGALVSVLSLASNLFESGVKCQLEAITNLSQGLEAANTYSNLPSYPWDHSTKHWHESRVTRQYLMRPDPYHDLLGVRVADSTPIEPRWRHMICLNSLPWLAHHVVDGVVVFPGSGYLCMVTEAIRQICQERTTGVLGTITLRNVSFHRALVVPNSPQRVEMQLSFDPRPNTSLEFAFRITACIENKWNEYCSGLVEGYLADPPETKTAEVELADQEIRDGLVLESQALYAELAEMGNAYGPSFSGIDSLTIFPDGLQARSVVRIPDTASLMPAGHQAAHLIHPSTLDILLHTALPLVRRKLGRGSVVPTYIEEVTLSATEATSSPNKHLTTLTKLTTGSIRTAHASLHVTSGGSSVLAATGLEMRNLGMIAKADESSSPEGICYGLEWKPDYDFISTANSALRPSRIEDLVGHICFKSGAISVLEFGTGNEELAIALINAVNSQGGRLLAYDLINGTKEHAATLEEKLGASSVPFSALSLSTGDDFKSRHYDVILISDAHMLTNVSSMKSDGTLLAQVKSSIEVNTWCAAAQAEQLLADVVMPEDGNEESSILMARPNTNRKESKPLKCLMLTHSRQQPGPVWLQALSSRVEGASSGLTIADICADLIISDQEDTCILVVDDQDQPILSDPKCFNAVTGLLNRPARIVWLSPDSPISMHQITGVSRTAHSENDKLRLTTIHASLDRLNSEELRNLIIYSLQRLNRPEDPCREREYWIRGDGTVSIPRLYPNEELNHAVLSNGEVEVDAFNQNHASSHPLDTHEIEMDTEAYSLSKQGLAGGLWEYVGVVSEVGSAVKDFAPGDRVVAISNLTPTNRIRISQDAVSRVPLNMSTTFSAVLLNLVAACHVLHKLADLPPSAVVWIHDIGSPLGRAILDTARSIGVRCITSASTTSEAREIAVQLKMPECDVLVSQRSLSGRVLEDISVTGLDAIILTGEESPPAGVVAQLKPFGCVVVMGSSGRRNEHHFKLPSNAAMYHCDIAEFLRCRPEKLAVLMKQVSLALNYVHTDGLNIYTYDKQTAKVLRKAEGGALVVIINHNSKTSAVAARNNIIQDRWRRGDASYVIVGGLGDLGKRLMILMAHRGARHLITLSRRLPSHEDQKKLQQQLSAIDPECRLYYISCDVTCENSVQEAAATLSRDGVPPVRGVIHSAAILEDRPLSFMTFHDFQLASQVKVDGTMALERAFASPSLEFFIMLSSAVNIVGASGQANYNAGNAVQDALAQVRQERHCRYISLNIGWIQDAVHTAENEARLAGLSRVGLRPIQSEELRRFFDFILANAYSTDQRLPQAIIGFDSGSLSNTTTHNGNLISPMFVHVRPNLAAITTLGSQDKTPPTATSFKQVLAAGERAAIIDFITAAICDQLSRLTSVDAARINADQSILELGLDSLIAIELRNWLTRTFDSPLQPSEILENQTVRTLGEKVASRSHLCQDPSSHEQNGTISQVNGNAKIENHTANESSLSPLPVPSLQETLRRFEESRRAIDSISEQKLTAGQVQAFIGGIGPILQEKVEGSKSSEIANSYERQIYLGRREPLQDYSEFTVGHPVDAPAHSQSLRAAIVTVAAAEFARQLASGEIPIDTLNGLPVSGEARNWLFWATRRPDNEVDYMERHTPSDTVIVLRRGHVFQLGLPSSNVPLQVAAVRAAFDDIMGLSEEPAPYVCTLTAGDRQSWFLARRELELETENSTILAAIDSAMFIICLDDESPITSGERHTQFLIGGQQPFINRWLDKPVQFAVTANGLSAGIYEHSKVDGLDVRMLHRHIVHALFNHDTVDNIDSSASVAHCTIHQHAWKTSPGVLKIMDSVKLQCDSYGYIDHLYFMAEELGLDHLRSHRISSHATAHIVALLAVYLVDKKIRPAWEIVSLANFAGGRLDWVQTVSPAIRSFLEKAAQLVESDDNKEDACRLLRSDFFTAVKGYSQVMSTAARGYGYVGHLYALHGAYLESQENVNTDKPDIFRGNAWNATRRGGLHQNFKIGFMPDDEPDYPHSWDEGGFLMHGDEGVYIHCGIRDHGIAFAISARPDYAKAVCKSLDHASKLISLVL